MSFDVSVDGDWVAAHLDDPAVRVVEVDVSDADYHHGHVPGAFLWDAYKDLRHPDYTPIDSDELDALLSRTGVTRDTTVVFYGYAALLAYWLMDRHGHDRLRVMAGPREGWTTSGHAWSTDMPQSCPGAYEHQAERAELVASRDQVQALIDAPDVVILDVRSPAEFSGDRFWPSGATDDSGRAGHIPGAVHVPVDVLDEPDGTAVTYEKLRRLYAEKGVLPTRKVVAYCTIGNRASKVAYLLKHELGYPDVAVYYGSWAEWGHLPDTPVET